MSNVDKLIAELCPDGVPFKTLGELLDYEQPTKYLVSSKEYDDSYPTPVLTPGQTFILGHTVETTGICAASPKQPVVLFDDFTTAFRWIDFPFKVKSSAVKLLSPRSDSTVNFRFVYYAMQCIPFVPSEHSRHWISKYSAFRIPVPPLDVQDEIARILDLFTALEAELEAELEARRTQHEQYLHRVLDFSSSLDVRSVPLSSVAEYSTSRVDASVLDASTFVGVDNLLQQLGGRVDATYTPNSSRLTAYEPTDILISNIRPYLRKVWFADRTGGCSGDVLAIRLLPCAKDDVASRFLYHVLSSPSFWHHNVTHAKGAKMPRGDKTAIMRFPVPVPAVEVQQSIVKILDSLQFLVSDISGGLPTEIAARRKQFEHYRTQLLTFKELEA